MNLMHIPADDLLVGDVIVTNPGDADEISGYLWQHVQVRRETQP